jgi:hypothetical protein
MNDITELRWEDPPVRSTSQRVFTEEVLAQLRNHPGRWAHIRTYRKHGGYQAIKHPRDIELRWVTAGKDTSLYARAQQTKGNR